jgi:hypothetical protein
MLISSKITSLHIHLNFSVTKALPLCRRSLLGLLSPDLLSLLFVSYAALRIIKRGRPPVLSSRTS